ncbi:MAG: zinc ribbon domain-containing protein [Myxococcales bacterium]|nr:zinc ribbon domain-containing protein [Myxococcales bacterium]
MIPFDAASRLLGLATASGTRAALSLLLLAAGARLGKVALPPGLGFLTHDAALGALLALSILEQATQRDDDVRKLLAVLSYGVHGLAGTLVGLAAQKSVGLEHAPPVALGAAGAALALLTQGARQRLHDALGALEHDVVSPRRWLVRLENGGVLGVAVAALLAPVVALAFVLSGAALTVAALVAARKLEGRARRPCPACGARIREEASRCPKCRAEVDPVTWRDLGWLHRAGALASSAATSLETPSR